MLTMVKRIYAVKFQSYRGLVLLSLVHPTLRVKVSDQRRMYFLFLRPKFFMLFGTNQSICSRKNQATKN